MPQFLVWLSFLVVPGLPWLALNAMATTPPHALVARVLLCCAAVWASAAGLLWFCAETGPGWVRVPAGLLLGAYVFVGLPQSFGWISARDRPPQQTPAVRLPPIAALHPRAAVTMVVAKTEAGPAPVETRPPTFRDMFDHDFTGLPSLGRHVGLESARTGEKTRVPVRLIFDTAARTKTLAVLIEPNTSSFNTCLFFLYNLDLVFQKMDGIAVENHAPGPTAPLFGKDFAFGRTLYFYMAEDISVQTRDYLTRAFRDQGYAIHFRGAAYYAMHLHDDRLQQPVTAQ